jgi:polyisoprenoid-binding protein YceI
VAPTTTAALCWSCAYEEASTTSSEASTTTLAPDETNNVDSKDASGTWSVDTTIGEFGIDEASGTFVGFRVKEVLGQGIGSATAVGRTPLVSGSAEIDGTTLVGAEIVADLTGLRTDRPMRDSRVQDALNTGAHPEATFVLSGPVDLGEGRQVQVPVPGSLTINGVTNTVTVDLAAELVGRILTVVGTIDVVFADYDVEAPTAPVVVSVEDHGIVEVQLFLTR